MNLKISSTELIFALLFTKLNKEQAALFLAVPPGRDCNPAAGRFFRLAGPFKYDSASFFIKRHTRQIRRILL